MIPPGFDCSRLVVVEVYTPAGNWSSYPPHKHDEHRVDENGSCWKQTWKKFTSIKSTAQKALPTSAFTR
jgi:5-deoxy-D-glucuronate isomerase